MPKPEWGTKRVCPTTGKRFYDLNRDPVVSPYTGEVVVIDTGAKGRTPIAAKVEKAKKEEVPEVEEVVLEEAEADVDLGDDVLEEDDEDGVSLDDIADVPGDEDDS